MTLGVADKQGDLFADVGRFCVEALRERSIYSFLATERDRLFPDEAFADLFDEKKGRRSVPASVVATVMVVEFNRSATPSTDGWCTQSSPTRAWPSSTVRSNATWNSSDTCSATWTLTSEPSS